jgi:putative phosphoesterase
LNAVEHLSDQRGRNKPQPASSLRRAAGRSFVGLISDTHGLLRPEALQALQGSDLIIHAGDVGKPEILDALKALAPVVAVRGNIDRGAWAWELPTTAVAEAGPARIYVLHDIHELDLDPAAAGFHVVVSGHSHKPARTERSGVLYVNPGSAGPRRFRLPVTVARLSLVRVPWEVSFIDLA